MNVFASTADLLARFGGTAGELFDKAEQGLLNDKAGTLAKALALVVNEVLKCNIDYDEAAGHLHNLALMVSLEDKPQPHRLTAKD